MALAPLIARITDQHLKLAQMLGSAAMRAVTSPSRQVNAGSAITLCDR